jgi:hypothetical protein
MGVRGGAAILAFTWLTVAAPAAAQLPPCIDPLGAGPVDFGFSLTDVADVIVVLKPAVDYPPVTGAEVVIQGDIQRVEKGVAPATIVSTQATLWAGLRAGVPARLFLKKFASRDAHYIIGANSSPNAPRDVGISIGPEGPSSSHVAFTGSTILVEGQITTRFAFPDDFTMDVYAGIIRPNGTTVSLTGTVFAPTFTESAAPLPFLSGVPEKPMTFGATYRLRPTDPPGWYVIYGLVARPRSDPRDPCGWWDTSSFPLLVIEPGLTDPGAP